MPLKNESEALFSQDLTFQVDANVFIERSCQLDDSADQLLIRRA